MGLNKHPIQVKNRFVKSWKRNVVCQRQDNRKKWQFSSNWHIPVIGFLLACAPKVNHKVLQQTQNKITKNAFSKQEIFNLNIEIEKYTKRKTVFCLTYFFYFINKIKTSIVKYQFDCLKHLSCYAKVKKTNESCPVIKKCKTHTTNIQSSRQLV